MERTVITRVKGTQYYAAGLALRDKLLYPGARIRLERDQHNPHDSTAVSVWLKERNMKLGHISRELSPKYSGLVASNRITSAFVDSVDLVDGRVKLFMRISYEEADHPVTTHSVDQNSRFAESVRRLEAGPGIYSITNTQNGRAYIGSSENIKNRGQRHLEELRAGRHANWPLQADYKTYGPQCFVMRRLRSCASTARLAVLEENLILEHRLRRADIYNLTDDGQGRVRPEGRHTAPRVSATLPARSPGTNIPSSNNTSSGQSSSGKKANQESEVPRVLMWSIYIIASIVGFIVFLVG